MSQALMKRQKPRMPIRKIHRDHTYPQVKKKLTQNFIPLWAPVVELVVKVLSSSKYFWPAEGDNIFQEFIDLENNS